MRKKYQSKILKAIHEDASVLYRQGIITDAEMKEYDEACLVRDEQKSETPLAADEKSLQKVSAK